MHLGSHVLLLYEHNIHLGKSPLRKRSVSLGTWNMEVFSLIFMDFVHQIYDGWMSSCF